VGVNSIRKLLSIFLITVIFISGNGVVFAIHKCIASDSQSVSFFKTHCSCEKEHKGECHDKGEIDFKSKCCTYQFNYYKINFQSPVKKVHSVDIAVSIPEFQILVSEKPAVSTKESAYYIDTSQGDILSHICKLLI
jgi:hypothetical protein